MAITQNLYTGNGTRASYPFTFPYLEETDVKVSLDGVDTTAYSFATATTLQFDSAPGDGVAIRIYRRTSDEDLSATFYSGSAIRANDLNDNFSQNLYVTQEVNNNAFRTDGSNPMVGDLNMAGYEVINLGTPTSAGAAVNKQYVDSRLGDLDIPGFTRWTLTAVGGETTLSGAGTTGGTLAYSVSREQVFLNGAQQQRGVDYTADDGTSVVFNVALTAGDVVEIICVNNLNTGTTAQAQDVSFVQSGAGAITRSVENKLRDVVSVTDFGAVGDGVTDDTAAIQAAFAATPNDGKLVFPAGSYKITGTVAVSNKTLSVDATGAKIFVAANVPAFTFSGSSSAEIYNLTADYVLGATSLSVSALPSALKDGTAFKIVSNAVDPGNRDEGSNTNQYRIGEWAVASGGTTTSITLRNPLRFSRGISPTSTVGEEPKIDSYTLAMSARILVPSQYSLTWIGGTIEYEDGHDADGWKSPCLTLTGLQAPLVTELSIKRGYQSGIAVNGCVGAKISSCSINNLTDNTSLSQFGYGIAEGGTYRTTVNGCTFANTRHGYTTSASSFTADSTDKAALLKSGRTQSSVIDGCVAYGKTVAAFDTHHDAEDTIFSDCLVEGGGVGFAARGRNISFVNCKAINVTTGFNIFTEYASGDPDDDLWVSGKPEGATTATIRGCTAHVINGVPVVVKQSPRTLLDSLDLKNTNHQMIANEGSFVEIAGSHVYEVTTYHNHQLISEVTNKGVFDLLPVNASFTGMWDARYRVLPGAGVQVNATAATDALNSIYLVRGSTSGMYLDLYGTIRAYLSSAFILLTDNLTVDGSQEGGVYWSVDGAADNSITTNLAGSTCKAQAFDGTVVHDWVTPGLKTIYKNPNTVHTGTGGTVSAVFRPEVEAAAYLNEAGHKIRYRIWLRKTGSTGVVTLTLRIGGDFFHTITTAAAAVGGLLEVDVTTRGANDQLCNAVWQPYDSNAALDLAQQNQFKYSLETINLSALNGYVLSIDANVAVGDTLTLDAYEVSCDLLSDGVI